MKNSSCVICGKEFEPREGKLYCSDKCKQYAYASKKNNSTPNTKEIETIPVKEIKPKYSINYNEYLEVKKMLEENNRPNTAKMIDICFYSFFRKNITGTPGINFIFNYICDMYSINSDFIHYIKNQDFEGLDQDYYDSYIKPMRQKYEAFLDLFHGDDFEITDGNNSLEKP